MPTIDRLHRRRVASHTPSALAPLFALALVGCSAASAQEEHATPSANEAEAGSAADVLSPYEVAAHAQQVTTSLTRVRARIHHVRELEHHLVVIEQLGHEVTRLRADSDLDRLEAEPRRELRNLHEQWAELDARLTETAGALEASSSALETEAAQVAALQRRWQRTAVAAAEHEYPQAARQQIAEVIAAIAEVTAELRDYLERVLAAQTRLAAHAIATGDVLAQIDRALEASQGRVFMRTHSPGLGPMPGVEPDPIGAQLYAAAIHHAHSLDRFATQLGERVYLHGLLTFGLLAFLYWLRREHRLEASSAARSLQHPIALTIFVSLLLVRPLYPLAPRAVIELSQLLAIGPLLSIPLSAHARTVMRLVVGLYAADWVRLSLDEHGLEHRVALAVIALVATITFAWIAIRTEGPARPAWGVASLVAGVGLAADLTGFVPLSALLVEGVIASAFFAVTLLAFHRAVMGWVDAALTTAAAGKTVLGRHGEVTRQVAVRASRLLFAAAWGWISLDYFQLRGAFKSHAELALSESVQLGDIEISIGDVLAFSVGIWMAVVLSRVLARTLQEDLAPRLGMGPGVPAAAALVLRYTVLALGFVLAASAAGIGLSQLSLFAGALGVGVGFGLQNIVANFVAGLLLVFERPVKVGDTVDVGGHRGVIREIGIRASTVRLLTGADIIIPNSKLTENELINWTHTDPSVRVDVAVGVAYGSDLRVAHDALRAAATSLEIALDSPPPSVLMTGFGDSSIDFQVRIWIANAADQPLAQSQLGLAIDAALRAASIEIPFPQRDVHIRSQA